MEEPGYIGIGWGQQEMLGAHIWFCKVNESKFNPDAFSEDCTVPAGGSDLFSCCLAIGTLHNAPQCVTHDSPIFYELEVKGKWLVADH
jgi:hypothetical protein